MVANVGIQIVKPLKENTEKNLSVLELGKDLSEETK